MNTKKIMTKIIMPIMAAAALVLPTQAQTKLTTGYNSIEQAAVVNNQNANSRTRTYVDIGAENNGYSIRLNGLNELSDLNGNTYFGCNRAIAGTKDLSIVARTLANNGGVFDTKFGIRNETLPQKLGATYGFIDATANENSANCTLLAGKVVKGWTGELFQSEDVENGKKPSHYTELQLYTPELAKGLKAFVRTETPQFKINESSVLAGIVYKF